MPLADPATPRTAVDPACPESAFRGCISPQIEHRLFSQITMNWRGRPLKSHQIIVDLISATTTATGLTVRCTLDTRQYPTGISYTDKEVAALNLERHDFHGDWNYTLHPTPDTPSTPRT